MKPDRLMSTHYWLPATLLLYLPVRLPCYPNPCTEVSNEMRAKAKCPTLPLLAIAIILQATPAAAQTRNTTASNMANDNAATTALHKLFDDQWEWTMRENPTLASNPGDRGY